MNNQDKKEVPPKKPEIEIPNPSPAVVPTPEPDQIRNIPHQEIIESPIESPPTEISEIRTSEITEM